MSTGYSNPTKILEARQRKGTHTRQTQTRISNDSDVFTSLVGDFGMLGSEWRRALDGQAHQQQTENGASRQILRGSDTSNFAGFVQAMPKKVHGPPSISTSPDWTRPSNRTCAVSSLITCTLRLPHPRVICWHSPYLAKDFEPSGRALSSEDTTLPFQPLMTLT